jgi:hypothetical protein
MSRRLVRPNARPYHGFPWTRAAMLAAVAMNSPMLAGPRVTLRTIADDLHARGLVDHKPDAATVRRMLASPKARALELELAREGTHGKNGLAELEAVKGGHQA